jgi:hypothetical protein
MKKYNCYGCGLIIVALAWVTLSGCGTTGAGAGSSASTSTASMSGANSKNAGRLIIQRAANMGSDLTVNISIDGKQVAALGIGQSYKGSVAPGEHLIKLAVVPNHDETPPTTKSLTVQAGQTYTFTAMWKGQRLSLM